MLLQETEMSMHSSIAERGIGMHLPSVLRASIKNSAKTWRGVSYAPFFPPPHWGFESPLSRFVNSARRSSYGIEDKEESVRKRRGQHIDAKASSRQAERTSRKGAPARSGHAIGLYARAVTCRRPSSTWLLRRYHEAEEYGGPLPEPSQRRTANEERMPIWQLITTSWRGPKDPPARTLDP